MTTTIADSTSTHTLALPWVRAAARQFVFVDEMCEAVSLALAAGLNLIFSGPGGHAKSEFLAAVFGAIQGTTPYIKSFGQGTSPEELYGGIDFDTLNRSEGAALQYNPALSFLAHHLAIFEEFFDAPARVLTSAKDTLTAGELRNGHQRYQMATRVIAAATNHSPQDIAAGGPEIAALIERFPIQLTVQWSSYTEDDFCQMFSTVIDGEPQQVPPVSWVDVESLQDRARNVAISKSMQRLLARIIVELRQDKVVISPRTAMMAVRLMQAAAAVNDRSRATPADIKAIAYLPGAHAHKARIAELIHEFSSSLEGEELLDQAEAELAEAASLRGIASAIVDLRAVHDLVRKTITSLESVRLTSQQLERRRRILQTARHMSQEITTQIETVKAEASIETHRTRLDEIERELRKIDRRIGYALDDERKRLIATLDDLTRETGAMAVHSSLHSKLDSVKVMLAATNLNRNFSRRR